MRADARCGRSPRRRASTGRGSSAAGRGPARRGGALDDGTRARGRAVIWACGGWLSDLFPGSSPLRVTLPGAATSSTAGRPGRTRPAGSTTTSPLYGTGDIDDLGVKAAPDVEGPPLDPDAELPEAARGRGARARATCAPLPGARRRAPLKRLDAAAATSCRRTRTSSPAPHPSSTARWIVGGGSGHGFKHGPAIAERIAAALDGREPLPDRFGRRPEAGPLAQDRARAASGATAGARGAGGAPRRTVRARGRLRATGSRQRGRDGTTVGGRVRQATASQRGRRAQPVPRSVTGSPRAGEARALAGSRLVEARCRPR